MGAEAPEDRATCLPASRGDGLGRARDSTQDDEDGIELQLGEDVGVVQWACEDGNGLRLGEDAGMVQWARMGTQ